MKATSLEQSLALEWLASNGRGGCASSTMAGCNTRRYHGLLVAALDPPGGRTLLVAKLDETLWVGSQPFPLGTNEFEDGTISPDGWRFVADFRLELGIPTWDFAFQDWGLEKKVWMEQGQNSTFVRYLLRGAPSACRLEIRPLCAYRDFHAEPQAGAPFGLTEEADHVRVEAFPGAAAVSIRCDAPAGFARQTEWWWRFLHRVERERGLNPSEALFSPGTLSVALLPGQPVQFRVTCEEQPAVFGQALERREALALQLGGRIERPPHVTGRAATIVPAGGLLSPDVLLQRKPAAAPPTKEDEAIAATLGLAARQFLVEGRRSGDGSGQTVIAGYHWFGPWGRATMISLPGLALDTGQLDGARDILGLFAGMVDRGMIPNTIGESGGKEYNNVDGTLWLFHALDRYLRASEDGAFLRELFPTLEGIVDWHVRGTRFGIKMDRDGLLSAGEPGMQLTWMDAKVDDWVVTPRMGKPVEVNALWFNAICLMAAWARELQHDAGTYQELAALIGKSFRNRFWRPDTGCLYDVVDGPDGDDTSLRPNQIFAVSLPFAPMYGPTAKAIVDTV